MKKEHLEILLENINSKFDLVLEGHAALDEKFSKRFNELEKKIEFNSFKIEVVSKKIDDVETRLGAKIDAVADDLTAHRADNEVHQGLYRVKEG